MQVDQYVLTVQGRASPGSEAEKVIKRLQAMKLRPLVTKLPASRQTRIEVKMTAKEVVELASEGFSFVADPRGWR